MSNTRRSFFPNQEVFSRQQLQAMTAIPDDVLAFWIKQGLLEPLPAGPRMHRRFGFEQIHIAVVLNAMRSLGANISVLRKFAVGLQRGLVLRRESGLDDEQLYYAASLARSLQKLKQSQPVEVLSERWEEDGADTWRLARNEADLIERWTSTSNTDADLPAAIPFAKSISSSASRWIDWALQIVEPDILSAEQDTNFVWIAWIDGNAEANIIWGENNSLPTLRGMFNAAFFLSISGLIRPLWPAAIRKAARAKEIDRNNTIVTELLKLEEADPSRAKAMRRRHGLPDDWADHHGIIEEEDDMTG